MTNEIRIDYRVLVKTIEMTLAAVGVPAPAREVEAEIMAEADLLGVPSHGVRMLPALVRGIREGRAKPNPRITILSERAAVCLVDGENGPGRFVSAQAMQMAVQRAQDYGVGVCLASRVTHWGRAHAYATRAARAGMVGICTTNAIPNMLAWGSSDPVLANNPVAIGVPGEREDEPIVLDMAMSQAALGKVGTHLREGKKVPANWGLDASGQPTDDPAAILASGRLVPFGEHKGTGLALMLELLTGALAGALLSHEIGRVDATGLDPNTTKLFIALDVEAFAGTARFRERVQELVRYLDSAETGLRIAYPGERGWRTRDRYLAEGIPIHPEIARQLREIGINL